MPLQIAGEEPAHRQAVHQVERKLAGGVVAAGQREDFVGQACSSRKFSSTCWEYSGRKVESWRAQISRLFRSRPLQPLQIRGRADHAPITAAIRPG